MSSEWSQLTIGDLVRTGEATLQTGPFGSQLHSYDYVESGVPVIPTEAIGRGRILDVDVPKVKQNKAAELARHRLCVGDILFARRGAQATGLSAIVDERFKDALCGTGALLLRVTSQRVDPEFLAMFLSSEQSYSWLRTHAVGAVMPNINTEIIKALPVKLPDVNEQRSLAIFFGAIDDRVRLLRETNTTLEAIAQALFKSWFVDFDPVYAKMQGRAPEGMDEATAALFPDSFEESELRTLPKGWSVASIYDVAKVIYGAPFASKQFKSEPPGKPLVRIRDLKDERPGVYTEEIHPKGYLLQPGDITVGMDGEFRAYVWGGEEAWLNQRVCVFQPEKGANSVFVRLSIAPLLDAVEASETATTVIHLGKNDIDRFKINHPGNLVLAAFASLTTPIYQRIVGNKQMIQNLAGLRDTLLPRLISGQLSVTQATVEADV